MLPTMPETEPRRWRIAKALKQARAQKQPRLSQADLAGHLAVAGLSYFTERHASRLELGYLDATTSEVRAIAHVLAVSPDWLCGALLTPVPSTPPVGGGLARASQSQMTVGPACSGAATATTTLTLPAVDSRWPACPPSGVLDKGDEMPDAYRLRLSELRAQANRMLHTSGLPAAQWRQWRDLERQVGERLRGL